jgi:hypothetical protein
MKQEPVEKSPGELKPIDFKEEMHRLGGDPLTWAIIYLTHPCK